MRRIMIVGHPDPEIMDRILAAMAIANIPKDSVYFVEQDPAQSPEPKLDIKALSLKEFDITKREDDNFYFEGKHEAACHNQPFWKQMGRKGKTAINLGLKKG